MPVCQNKGEGNKNEKTYRSTTYINCEEGCQRQQSIMIECGRTDNVLEEASDVGHASMFRRVVGVLAEAER